MIVAAVARQLVVAEAAVDPVVAQPAREAVGAREPVDPVVAAIAEDQVAIGRSGDGAGRVGVRQDQRVVDRDRQPAEIGRGQRVCTDVFEHQQHPLAALVAAPDDMRVRADLGQDQTTALERIGLTLGQQDDVAAVARLEVGDDVGDDALGRVGAQEEIGVAPGAAGQAVDGFVPGNAGEAVVARAQNDAVRTAPDDREIAEIGAAQRIVACRTEEIIPLDLDVCHQHRGNRRHVERHRIVLEDDALDSTVPTL